MITQERLHELFDYSEDTGIFTWIAKSSKYSNVAIGSIAGCKDSKGYLIIRLDKKDYKAHRLAWLYTYGYIPEFIDHINQKKDDNRIDNLREATKQENARNVPLKANNSSGATGIYFDKRNHKWKTVITVDSKEIFLGNFIEFSEAVNARKNAEVLYGFHENHGRERVA